MGSTNTVVYYDEYDVLHLQAQQKYRPWGQPRQVTGELPTDRTFQGQRDPGWGLSHFGARWFDSNLGRFAQADTIVPGVGNPLAWDRFAGLGNNPVRYVDPTGHLTCDDVDDEGKCVNYKQQNNRLYNKLISQGSFESVPEIEDFEWEIGFGSISHLKSILDKYELIRRELFISYGYLYVDKNGKIDDQVIMALIISSELAAIRDQPIYSEAIEALSNQYDSAKSPSGPMQCHHDCSLTDQILWATQMQAIYDVNNFVQTQVASGAFEAFLNDARLAANGYSIGIDDSWFWGNVSESRLKEFDIVDKIPAPGWYPNTHYFIVHR